LKHVLRQDPNVVLVGEMRDLETIRDHDYAGRDGSPRLRHVHTNSAPDTIERIVDSFPAGQQARIRLQLVCIARHHRANPDPQSGRSLIAAHETLVNNTAIAT